MGPEFLRRNSRPHQGAGFFFETLHRIPGYPTEGGDCLFAFGPGRADALGYYDRYHRAKPTANSRANVHDVVGAHLTSGSNRAATQPRCRQMHEHVDRFFRARYFRSGRFIILVI